MVRLRRILRPLQIPVDVLVASEKEIEDWGHLPSTTLTGRLPREKYFMKKPIDLARQFLIVADNDIKVFHKLVDDDDIADASVGFHAQQAVEKCLKAVLVLRAVKFRKKHDLGELLELFEQNNLPLPPMSDVLDELNPYAVTLRYDLVYDMEALNRDRVKEIN
jgi:hypothetical protein